MFLQGDEFGNTQFGNNNAYCQDNEISWLDWSELKKNRSLFTFVKDLIAFRKAHPVLRNPHFDTANNGTGYPELSFHFETPWQFDPNQPRLVFACLFVEDAKKYGTERDAYLYILYNQHWEEHTFSLPIIPKGHKFHLVSDSFTGESHAPGDEKALKKETVTLKPRSIMILIG